MFAARGEQKMKLHAESRTPESRLTVADLVVPRRVPTHSAAARTFASGFDVVL